ncbi:MAG TPA: outer membrane lipoprotein-sorting protein [Armatimonadota bacterium]
MKFALPALCAAAIAVAGCSRVAQPDGLTILARYHGADETSSYTVNEMNVAVMAIPRPDFNGRGVVGPVSTLLHRTHVGPDQWRYDVISTEGPAAAGGMVQARNGQTGWRYVPAAHRIELLTFPSKDVGALDWMALILNNYHVEGVRSDTVANTPAWYLEVRPKNPGRPMKRLWVDKETYLPLRQELWSADGRLVSATQAVERPQPIPAGDLALLKPPAASDLTVVQWNKDYRLPETEIAAALGFPLARLPQVPRGFAPVGTYLSILPDTFGACARWELTDGIATLNVFQTRKDLGASMQEDVPGDVNGPAESAERGPYHFLVAGNLRRKELRRIADDISVGPR